MQTQRQSVQFGVSLDVKGLRMKRLGHAMAVACFVSSTSMFAQERPQCSGAQIGTWALKAYTSEVLATGEKRYPLGEHPTGFLTYGPDCRMQAILLRGSRSAPAAATPTDAERIQLYDGLMAYAGAYAIDGDRVSHKIDASWNQAWTGTTLVRQFKIEGDTLTVKTMPAANPFDARDTTVGVLVWTKVR